MKRTIFAIAMAALVLGGCLSTQNSAQNSGGQNSVGVPNPFFSFKRLEDAEKKAGFDFNLLDVFENRKNNSRLYKNLRSKYDR